MIPARSLLISALIGGAVALSGCATTDIKKEEISAGTQNADKKAVESASTKDDKTVAVPDERPAQEVLPADAVTSTDLNSASSANASMRKEGLASSEPRPEYASIPKEEKLSAVAAEKGRLFTIYFDFDNYSIRATDAENLSKNARWLGLNQSVRVVIEGHADERGEEEYNLALGDKRAQSVKRYLSDLGISDARLEVVSYGEERPVDQGHDEDAWSKNRRADFVIQK